MPYLTPEPLEQSVSRTRSLCPCALALREQLIAAALRAALKGSFSRTTNSGRTTELVASSRFSRKATILGHRSLLIFFCPGTGISKLMNQSDAQEEDFCYVDNYFR